MCHAHTFQSRGFFAFAALRNSFCCLGVRRCESRRHSMTRIFAEINFETWSWGEHKTNSTMRRIRIGVVATNTNACGADDHFDVRCACDCAEMGPIHSHTHTHADQLKMEGRESLGSVCVFRVDVLWEMLRNICEQSSTTSSQMYQSTSERSKTSRCEARSSESRI